VNRRRIRNRIATLLCSTLVAISLAGCAAGTGGGSGPGGSGAGGSGAGGSGASRTITGSWQLLSGTDAKGAITPGAARVTFTINGKSSGGRGPCNAFGATTRGTTTSTISIVVDIHTDMACVEPDQNTTESRYFAALNTVTRAALDNGTLTLSGGGDSLVFTRATK
jgi:heat shock protein HslJ